MIRFIQVFFILILIVGYVGTMFNFLLCGMLYGEVILPIIGGLMFLVPLAAAIAFAPINKEKN